MFDSIGFDAVFGFSQGTLNGSVVHRGVWPGPPHLLPYRVGMTGWAAAIGIVGTLLGLLIGKLWDRSSADRTWIRDERSQAYREFVRQVHHMRHALRRIATYEEGSADWNEARVDRRSQWTAYNTALTDIETYGSAPVHQAALVLDRQVRVLSAQVYEEVGGEAQRDAQPALTLQEWDEARLPVDSSMRSYVDEIRRELGIEPLDDRKSWVAGGRDIPEPKTAGLEPAQPR